MIKINKKRFAALSAVVVMLLALAGPAGAAQTFSLADFSGEWYWFLIGAYDEYTETADAKFTLTGDGTMIAGASGTFNNYPATYLSANLAITPEGYVSGTLECDQVVWHIVRAAMDQAKTEVSGTAWGYKSAVIFRMVRVSGEPAEIPGTPTQ